MIWKIDGVTQKTPSTYRIECEDFDKDSYRSAVTGALIDSRIAAGMHSCRFEFDFNSEEEAEELLAQTRKNPMNVYIKSPFIAGGFIEAPFRCSKRSIEMYRTGNDEDASKSKWKLSFNIVQKRKVSGQ